MKRIIVGDPHKYVEVEIRKVPLYRKEVEEEKESIIYSIFSPKQAWGNVRVMQDSKDKTFSAAVAIAENPAIILMQKTIDAVDVALFKYPELKPLCELYFWQDLGWKEVCEKLGIAQATLFKRKDKLIRVVAKILCIHLDPRSYYIKKSLR